MILLCSGQDDGWEDVALFDEERLWSRVLEIAEGLDEEEENYNEKKKDFNWGDLYEQDKEGL